MTCFKIIMIPTNADKNMQLSSKEKNKEESIESTQGIAATIGDSQHATSVTADADGVTYIRIPVVENNDKSSFSLYQSWPKLFGTNRSEVKILITVVVTTIILLSTSLIFWAIATSSQSDHIAVLLNISTTRFCSFGECIFSKCNPNVAPYICLQIDDGANLGGCSSIAWTISNITCNEQCDTSICSYVQIPDEATTCVQQICATNWCNRKNITSSTTVCSVDIPYQCTNGTAMFGCSNDPVQWSSKVDVVTCSSCCDIRTC